MKVVQIDETTNDIGAAINSLKIVEKPIPKPGPGEVLVMMEAAPCNPSDLLFLQGKYGVKKTLPAVPGWEGAGVVVETGKGVLPWLLKGKRVACGGQENRDGTWAEYYVANAKACIPLNKGISSAQGSTLIINPLTAIGMVDETKRRGHRAIIQTAACSQVGRMVQALCQSRQIPLINIVRREEQLEELKAAGEKWVLSSSSEDFGKQLKRVAKELRATVIFEAVAGSLTGTVLSAMPIGSEALVYGALSEQHCSGISPLDLIFKKKIVRGFWLTQWLESTNFFRIYGHSQVIQTMMKEDQFRTKIRLQVGFSEWKEALIDYHKEMTSGKVILTPAL
ncbi:MAG: zinc-binding dehydrogenase [Chlamydiota bacterium]